MNSDVVLNGESLTRLWRFLDQHPEAGVCAPRTTYEDGRDQGMVFHRSLPSHYADWLSRMMAQSTKRKIARAVGPVQVDGVLGAIFLIRRSLISPSGLFDEDFFFFYEDTSLAHGLANRSVKSFVVPDAVVVHLGGRSRSANSVAFFYESKYLYLKKFYGTFHARAVYWLDRGRIFRKWLFYSLISLVTPSKRLEFKREHYKIARQTVRLK
jgi:GT2 family glycosyltransferase